jgi:phosphatidylserine/phosphatidylglycerophosphate/cardiolipin synthase-like enzyme
MIFGAPRAALSAAGLALALSASSIAPPALAFDPASAPLAAQGTLQSAFSPWEDVEGLIVQTLEGAQSQILVQAYLLTSRKIAATLVAARRRGVEVRVLADAEQHTRAGSASRLAELAAAGVGVWLETRYQNAHNKIIVIDAGTSRATVITGSFNFTWAAQNKNAENILIVRNNQPLAGRYALNWERHRQEAIHYK